MAVAVLSWLTAVLAGPVDALKRALFSRLPADNNSGERRYAARLAVDGRRAPIDTGARTMPIEARERPVDHAGIKDGELSHDHTGGRPVLRKAMKATVATGATNLLAFLHRHVARHIDDPRIADWRHFRTIAPPMTRATSASSCTIEMRSG